MGCRLQEAASKYQYEGFSRIYVACAGTNMQKLIDLLETMFGDMDMDEGVFVHFQERNLICFTCCISLIVLAVSIPGL